MKQSCSTNNMVGNILHTNKYVVYDDEGGVICYINQSLVEKQGITEMGLVSIKLLHKERHHYVKGMQDTDVADKVVLQWFAAKITEADRELQKLWGFPVDDNYHRWWEVPFCECPIADNKENYGTPYRHINGLCPIHGE